MLGVSDTFQFNHIFHCDRFTGTSPVLIGECLQSSQLAALAPSTEKAEYHAHLKERSMRRTSKELRSHVLKTGTNIVSCISPLTLYSEIIQFCTF